MSQLVRNHLYDRLCETENCVICPNGREGDCMSVGIVCLISCNICGDEYIGETGRPLGIRIKEQLDGKFRSRESNPLRIHRIKKHNGDDFGVKVTILAQEQKTSRRKISESFLINFRSPRMNRKEECLSMTHEISSYLRLMF